MATLVEQILLSLKEHGAEEIFGIPGDYVISIFKTIQDSKILPLYTLSHEPGVGFAADGAARFNRRISVACVTYGAGALNMVNPIAGAYAERVPVVVISGYPAYKSVNSKLRMHHELKTPSAQFEVFKNITCDQARINDISTAPANISRVLESCLKNSRPVYIEISGDLYSAECQPIPKTYSSTKSYENSQTPMLVEETIKLLKNSKNPLILLGYELLRFQIEKQAVDIANKLGINSLTTLMSRNIKGFQCFKGALGNHAISEVLLKSDTILNLGAMYNDSNFSPKLDEFKGKNLISVCEDTVEINNQIYNDIHIKDFLNQLQKRAYCFNRSRNEIPAEPHTEQQHGSRTGLNSYDIINSVNKAFSRYEKLPLVSDIGDAMLSSMRVEPDETFSPWFYGAMGYAVPAGIGLHLSSGKRPLIMVGDGDFQMTGWELCNCAKYGIDPIVIVFNNSTWGILNAIKTPASFNSISRLNYSKIACELGGTVYKAQTTLELDEAVNKAFQSRGKFQLIDVTLDSDTNCSGILSELSKLIKGR